MALTGIAAEVEKSSVGVLLAERESDILDREYDGESMFDAIVRQIAAEVVPVTGPNPQGSTRELALQCIAYGVASNIEYAEFPEQQAAGDTGRGYFLKKKFTELLDMLRTMPKGGGSAAGISRARFPEPRRYPDPFIVR